MMDLPQTIDRSQPITLLDAFMALLRLLRHLIQCLQGLSESATSPAFFQNPERGYEKRSEMEFGH